MEFTGQIIKVLPKQSGVSARTGNPWTTQGFVFEYKEHDTDPWHDRVYLETFDTRVQDQLAEGAVAKIGFRHRTREYNGKQYNDVTMNSFQLIGRPMETQPTPFNNTSAGSSATHEDTPPLPSQTDNIQTDADDLPF